MSTSNNRKIETDQENNKKKINISTNYIIKL